MGMGYVRNDTANNIADGNIINASDLDGEYDAIQSAFDASTGHTHDGTAGEGAPIETIGPSQDVVATASVLRPKTDNTVDLGTTSLEYKDLFLDGTAHIDTLDVDENASITGTLGVTGTTTLGTANITTGTITTADINGGNIDGTIIGATTAAAITGTTITGTSFVTSGDITFGDNDKAIFGAGSDLQIYHSGSNSHITEGGTGNLIIRADDFRVQSNAGEEYIAADANGAVSLRYDNALKLSTTSTGIDVTGTVTADGLVVAPDANRDVQVSSFGTFSMRLENTTVNAGGLIDLKSNGGASVTSGSKSILKADGATGDISFYEDTGTTPKFFWDASAESLGIGTSSPASKLHIQATDTAGVSALEVARFGMNQISNYGDGVYSSYFYNTSTEGARIGMDVSISGGALYFSTGGSTERMRIDSSGYITSTASNPQISFVDSANSSYKWSIQNTSSAIRFYDNTATTERMRIDSSGNVGIGASSPNSYASKRLHLNGSSTSVALRLTTTTTGSTVDDGSDIEVSGSDLNIINRESANTVFFTANAERMRLDSSGHAIIPAGVTLGTAAGVYSAANTLDDYEEGTFTPVWVNVSGVSLTYAKYLKIGNTVNIWVRFTATGGITANSSRFTGLPFAATSLASGVWTRGTIEGGFVEQQIGETCYFSSAPSAYTGTFQLNVTYSTQ